MNLTEKINNDIKAAMLAKEKDKLEALRAVKAAILLEQTSGKGTEMTPDAEIKLLQKLIKQRRDAADIYKSQNRDDLYQAEVFQLEVIQTYLPAQLSDNELIDILKQIIVETGATNAKDMGKVMAAAQVKLAGKAESKVVAEKVKQLLTA